MGEFREHVLFGFLLAAVSIYAIDELFFPQPMESLAAGLSVFIGSVIPDIDHSNSYVYRSVKSLVSIVGGAATFLAVNSSLPVNFLAGTFMLLTVYYLLSNAKIRHRGYTHSMSFCLTFSSIVTVVSVYLFASFIPGIATGVGLLSHLMLDREIV